MGLAVIHYCDECYTVKNMTNHWSCLYVRWESLVEAPYIVGILLLDDARVKIDDMHMVCGAQCLNRARERYRTTGILKGQKNGTPTSFCDVSDRVLRLSGVEKFAKEELQQEEENLGYHS